MLTAEDPAIVLETLADHAAAAMCADRRDRVDGTLK
jgi:hypothetical protein